MTAYLISGQAADEKLFENLSLPSYLKTRYVHWIEPLQKESLVHYCKRLSDQIDASGEFVLIGVSLGGIVSVELSKLLDPKQIFIISSMATRGELRPVLKLVRLLRIHKIVPGALYKLYTPILNWYFGAKTERERELLRYYTKTASKNYMKWAVNEILNWKNETRPDKLLHIHGTNDRIFPYKRTHADVKVAGGNHLMVHNRAEEISKILSELLNASEN
ncbi:MAG: alpha/beta hydrolase [Flavisolibacter sp.]